MKLLLRDREFDIQPGHPLLMGIVNVNDDSVADQGMPATVERAKRMVEAGATLIDVGAESGRTDRPPRSATEEAAMVVPLIEALSAAGVAISIDTFKPEVARAAVDAGAVLVNDVSGLADPALADIAAESGAGLVVMHTRAAPKTERFPHYDDVVADVLEFLVERMATAEAHGVPRERIVLDPGPDFAKRPKETVEVLRRLPEVAALGAPVLLAVSRKYFVGVITGRLPDERLAGTLAAIGDGVDAGAAIVRVHDVAQAADYLRTRAVLRGAEADLEDRSTDDRLKWLPAER
jgi:dihydropteroate synthase